MTKYNAYCLIRKTGVINLELEEIISRDYDCSLCYALYILKYRFRLGEEMIVQNYFNICDYCYEVMRYDHD